MVLSKKVWPNLFSIWRVLLRALASAKHVRNDMLTIRYVYKVWSVIKFFCIRWDCPSCLTNSIHPHLLTTTPDSCTIRVSSKFEQLPIVFDEVSLSTNCPRKKTVTTPRIHSRPDIFWAAQGEELDLKSIINKQILQPEFEETIELRPIQNPPKLLSVAVIPTPQLNSLLEGKLLLVRLASELSVEPIIIARYYDHCQRVESVWSWIKRMLHQSEVTNV
jgi:hypothetical protein